jgi:protein SCO1/2
VLRKRGPRTPLQHLALVCAAALAVGIGYYLGNRMRGEAFHVPSSPQVLTGPTEPLTLETFDLRDHYGRPFTPAQLAGRWTLIATGATGDAEACRDTLTRLVLVHNQLVDRPDLQRQFQAVFVTRAPQVDTAESLRDLVSFYSPDFLGVRGDADQLDRLTQTLGLEGAQTDGGSDPGFALVDPQGQFRGRFTPDRSPATIAADIKSLARSSH